MHRVSLQDTPEHRERGITVSWENLPRNTQYKIEFLTKVNIKKCFLVLI